MNTIKITRWNGRLGNNILQLKKAILFGLYNNYNIELPKHPFFNTTFIKINKEKGEKIYVKEDIFFYLKIKPEYNINYEKMKTVLLDIFIINYKTLKPSDPKDLCIHIRSGDLFHNFSPGYIPPPLYYYQKIINEGDWNKITIISEDRLNPVIDKILELYPNINFSINSLEKDIKSVLTTTNIVFSIGTFIPMLLLLTEYTNKVFYPSYDNNKLPDTNKIKFIHIKNYMNKFDKENIRLILEYKV